MEKSVMLAAALEYAERGWLVFPCRVHGKAPLTAHGFKDATLDAARIREWWGDKWPSANIGVATGRMVVLDVDGAQGEQTLAEHVAQHGPLPETLEAKTGKGRHIYFHPNGTTIRNDVGRKLGAGLDVRADGGYVIVSPSIHESGKQYEWVRSAPLADIPGWLAG